MNENVVNDCLALVVWFYRNSGREQDLYKCSEETGIPVNMIRKYIYDSNEVSTLESIATTFGYNIKVVNCGEEYLFVGKNREKFI